MPASPLKTWSAQDVPAVAASDLLAALALWLARERQGCVLVTDTLAATIDTIEETVLGMFENDPARGISTLVRLRCLTEALASRRFRHFVRGTDSSQLGMLASAAAGLRLNIAWGMSPVRLAWLVAAQAQATSTAPSDALAA